MADTSRSDSDLVGAVLGGDKDAFGELFARWFDRVHDVARNVVRDSDMASDVAQDAFVIAWTRLPTLRDRDAFGGWLLRIARNGALDRLRRDGRTRSQSVEVVTDMHDAGATDPTSTSRPPDPATVTAERDRDALIAAAAAVLGERDTSLLDLHLRHGLSPAEIAAELGVEPNSAHQMLFRLRSRLGDAIGAFVLWSRGRPVCAELRAVTSAFGGFDSETFAVVERHRKGCEECRERRALLVAPEQLFAAAPVVAVPLALTSSVADRLVALGVPVGNRGGAAAGKSVEGSGAGGHSEAGADRLEGDGPASAGSGSGSGSGSGVVADVGSPGGGGGRRRRLVVVALAAALILGVLAVMSVDRRQGQMRIAVTADAEEVSPLGTPQPTAPERPTTSARSTLAAGVPSSLRPPRRSTTSVARRSSTPSSEAVAASTEPPTTSSAVPTVVGTVAPTGPSPTAAPPVSTAAPTSAPPTRPPTTSPPGTTPTTTRPPTTTAAPPPTTAPPAPPTTTPPPPPPLAKVTGLSVTAEPGGLICAVPSQSPRTFTWSSVNATSGSLAIGGTTRSVGASGQLNACAASGQTATLTVTGPGGSDDAQIVIP